MQLDAWLMLVLIVNIATGVTSKCVRLVQHLLMMELKNMEELQEIKKQKRMEAILDQQLFMKNLLSKFQKEWIYKKQHPFYALVSQCTIH